jgi:hypothetical protein
MTALIVFSSGKLYPEDLFKEVEPKIELEGGTVSVDDMVIDKLYSDPTKAELIDYFWSGKHKKLLKELMW